LLNDASSPQAQPEPCGKFNRINIMKRICGLAKKNSKEQDIAAQPRASKSTYADNETEAKHRTP
jgi:hypothetical protein